MNELIPLNKADERITVSARDLHRFLESNERFSKWFERMIGYGFVEGVDFNPYQKVQVHIEGSRTVKRMVIDYQLTVDCAKQISMLQRNELGMKARKYFIEIDNDWNSPEKIMARALQISQRELSSLRIENEVMKPKALYFDDLVERNTLTSLRDTAKMLKIGQKDFIDYLIRNGYLFRQGKKGTLKPYIHYNDDLFKVKETAGPNGWSGTQTLVTPKGRETFNLLLNHNGY